MRINIIVQRGSETEMYLKCNSDFQIRLFLIGLCMPRVGEDADSFENMVGRQKFWETLDEDFNLELIRDGLTLNANNWYPTKITIDEQDVTGDYL